MRFQILLGAVAALFVAILIAAYAAARHAHPVLLDEHGTVITDAR